MRSPISSSLIFAVVALYAVACGGESQFRGGSIPGTKKSSDESKKESADAEQAEIAVPKEAEDGTIIPIDSGTNHDSLELNSSVVFGDDKVFRVGDGEVKGTSCMDNISAYDLSGTTYNFPFEVTGDETVLQIKIDTLCGIDVNDYNLLYIESASGKIQKASLKKGQTSVVLQALMLDAGQYRIVVESTKIKSRPYRGEWDDFIVGKIFVNSDKKIIPGEVSAH